MWATVRLICSDKFRSLLQCVIKLSQTMSVILFLAGGNAQAFICLTCADFIIQYRSVRIPTMNFYVMIASFFGGVMY